MTNETAEKAKADLKKGIAETGKAGAYIKADAKADINAAVVKGMADVKNKMAHAKADLEKAKADHRK